MKNILFSFLVLFFIIACDASKASADIQANRDCKDWKPEIATKQDSKDELYRKLEKNTEMQRRCQYAHP